MYIFLTFLIFYTALDGNVGVGFLAGGIVAYLFLRPIEVYSMDPTIPQGFSDAVLASFKAKVKADDSAALVAAAETELNSIKATVANQVATAQAAVDAATKDHETNVANLDASRKALESLEEAYLTVGGTLPG